MSGHNSDAIQAALADLQATGEALDASIQSTASALQEATAHCGDGGVTDVPDDGVATGDAGGDVELHSPPALRHAKGGLRRRRGGHAADAGDTRPPHPLSDNDLSSGDELEDNDSDVKYIRYSDVQFDEALFEKRRKAALVYPEEMSAAMVFRAVLSVVVLAGVLYNFLHLAWTGRHMWLVSRGSHWLYEQYMAVTEPDPRHAPGVLGWWQSVMPSDDVEV